MLPETNYTHATDELHGRAAMPDEEASSGQPTAYTFQLRERPSAIRREALALEWEPDGSSRAYDNGLTGWEAWADWRRFNDDRIYWFVVSLNPHSGFGIEGAPFHPTSHYDFDKRDFLDYYTWPVGLRWTDLPVVEGKSAWMYDLTGWRPAPFTWHVPVAALEAQR